MGGALGFLKYQRPPLVRYCRVSSGPCLTKCLAEPGVPEAKLWCHTPGVCVPNDHTLSNVVIHTYGRPASSASLCCVCGSEAETCPWNHMLVVWGILGSLFYICTGVVLPCGMATCVTGEHWWISTNNVVCFDVLSLLCVTLMEWIGTVNIA